MTKIAFVLPGQGSQKVGMGKDLIENYEEAKIFFEKANTTLKEEGVDVSKLCFIGPEEELKNYDYVYVVDLNYGYCRDNLFNFLEKDVEIDLGVKEGEIYKMDQNKKRN